MTEKQTRKIPAATLLSLALVVAPLYAQQTAQQQQPRYNVPSSFAPAQPLKLPPMPVTTAITANGKVVEDVVARINDQIITRTDYQHSEEQVLQEALQQHATQAEVDDRIHNLLRDMIDQQLLLSKGKELGINCDADVVRRLDEIRKEQHLDSMEALEKAATEQGVSFEDFKQGIRNQCVTQQVVRDEIGRHVSMTHADEQAFYDAHKAEFVVPEQIHLSEILIPTPDNATDAQVSQAQAKADEVAAKLKSGANFTDVAKTDSGGPNAAAGGDLGDFKRGTLGDILENATFPLPVGGTTAPIRTRQGFVILKVNSHQQPGTPPLDTIEPQVQEALYMEGLQPAMRAYLTKARDQAYMNVKDGFVDSGQVQKKSNLGFTAYTPPPPKKKIVRHQAAEQERAAKASAALTAAREKVAEKQAQKAATDAQKAGVKNVSAPVKPKKVRKEKIRYGEAPRNSLPRGSATTETAAAPIAGQAPGVAMAPTQSMTSITTGTGLEAENSDSNPLDQQATSDRKTRFSSRESAEEERVAKAKLAKAETKATMRSVAATPEQTADEKLQAAPRGLNGDTVKKQKKKKQKGDPKERLQEKPKEDTTPNQVAPTVNPALGPGAPPAPVSTTPPPADSTTPSATTPAPK